MAKVAIIGAGISGLLACKHVASKGFDPVVFEAKDDIGGLWTKTLETTRLQTPKILYRFSDFPWPESVTDEYPTQAEVIDYVRSYATQFDLLKHIRFHSQVIGIDLAGLPEDDILTWTQWGGNGEPFASNRRWILRVQDSKSLATEDFVADFVILCLGRFSEVPNLPDFPPGMGPEAFRGQVVHSMHYSALDCERAREFVKGKRVTVVGFQKSALDIAMECSSVNGVEFPCTVLYRTKHWHLPDDQPWGVPFALLYLNRLAELLVHKPGEGLLLFVLAVLLFPLRWLVSKLVESHIKRKLRLAKFGMVPQHRFLQQLSSCLVAGITEDFYDRVDKGSIILHQATSLRFSKAGIMVDGSRTATMETDLVILATGFRGEDKIRHIFESETFRSMVLGSADNAVPLYRECIHPRVPQLAIIGFSESVSNLYTSEIRSRWLAELLQGTFKLPKIADMEKSVSEWDDYKKRSSGVYYRRSCIGGLHIWYNDQLCRDMGWNPRRKKGFISEFLEPYGPTDYASP